MNALKPVAPKSDAVEATAKRKAKAKTAEPIEESWRKIFAMKLSDADRKRVTEVKAAMDAGKLARDPADCVNKAGNPKAFSKAEALRLWKTLQESQREETLRGAVTAKCARHRQVGVRHLGDIADSPRPVERHRLASRIRRHRQAVASV